MNDRPEGSVSVESLSIRYPGARKIVLPDFSLSFAPSKLHILIGANGSGKTTLLKAIARLLTPQSGRIVCSGLEIGNFTAKGFARELGILFQENTAPADITVEELALHGRYPHLRFLEDARAIDREIVQDALQTCGIAHLATRRIGELSSGQRQLAWIALLVAQRPRVLLLDEPTTYLDLSFQIKILDLLRDLKEKKNVTLILSLHDLNMASLYADRLYALKDGVLLASGSPAELLTESLIRDVFGVSVTVVHEAGACFCVPKTGSFQKNIIS